VVSVTEWLRPEQRSDIFSFAVVLYEPPRLHGQESGRTVPFAHDLALHLETIELASSGATPVVTISTAGV